MSQSIPISARIPKRSMGLKLLLVCGLALLMSIPALAVFGILSDRTQRAEGVTQEIGELVGGPQNFAGPILAVPFTQPVKTDTAKVEWRSGIFIVFPTTANASVDTKTSVRERGLFKTPVWTADLGLRARFDLKDVELRAPAGAVLNWAKAEILTGVSDARGAREDIGYTIAGEGGSMTMTSLAASLSAAGSRSSVPAAVYTRDVTSTSLQFFGAPMGDFAKPGAVFEVEADLHFSGARSLAVLAYGQTTMLNVSGDWADPSYSGDFAREGESSGEEAARGSKDGYAAKWSVPMVRRGVPGEGEADVLGRLDQTAMRVSFVDTANPYQAVSRSLKYALMFVGLVFLAYFLFETVQKKRVHPAQYVLIGLAQIIFYLLLLSLAERVGFDLGFLIAAAATVSLISAYAGWVFESRKQGFVALAAFIGLYGLIYVLMRLEDWALLVGAVASFAAIAAVMYFTRRLDWYGVGEGGKAESGAA